ncbi:MAG TPA: chemotaxis protein CheW [Thermoanaerobaculia bacterium]|nr:chemotaxis protein CheW [Thermoanaerobaculia bacterium]
MAEQQYLSFFVAGEEYAIAILQVTEIIAAPAMTKVPSTPEWIRGVLNLRGAVVPVIDLGAKLGLAAAQVTPRTCVVIVEVRRGDDLLKIGIMADSVHQVIGLSGDQIQPPPSFGTNVKVEEIVGMALLDHKLVLLLDVDRVLTWSESGTVASLAGSEVAAEAQ